MREPVLVPSWLLAALAALPVLALLVGLAIGYGVAFRHGVYRERSASAMEGAGDLMEVRLQWLTEAAAFTAVIRPDATNVEVDQ